MRKNLFLFILVILCAGSINTAAQDAPLTAKTISGGVVNGKATSLVKPAYPAAARAVRASGSVNVQVTIDEEGSVIAASAVSGHPLLRAAAVEAARASKFAPTRLSGQPVKVTGVIVYNFVADTPSEFKEPYWALGMIISLIQNADPQLIAELDKAMNSPKGEDFDSLVREFGTDVPEEFGAQKQLFVKFSTSKGEERRQIAAEISIALKNQIQGQQLWQYEIGENLGLAVVEILKYGAQEKGMAFRVDEQTLRAGLTGIKNAATSIPEGISPAFSQRIIKIGSFANAENLLDQKTFEELFMSIDPLFDALGGDDK